MKLKIDLTKVLGPDPDAGDWDKVSVVNDLLHSLLNWTCLLAINILQFLIKLTHIEQNSKHGLTLVQKPVNSLRLRGGRPYRSGWY